jgi:hypothetical protein
VRHAQIRDAVEQRLRSIHGDEPATRYRHELGLCMGETRVDVAAINGRLTGCEIKGSSDRLTRLPRQVALYGSVLDAAILVVEGRHARDAAAMVPSFWGVWHAAESATGDCLLEEVAAPRQNPDVQALPVAQLLWRDEALDELRRRGLARGLASGSRWHAWDRLVETLPLEELKHVVRERLKARPDWTGGR